VESITEASSAIEKDSQKVLEASNITVETIYRMDQHIGKFKV